MSLRSHAVHNMRATGIPVALFDVSNSVDQSACQLTAHAASNISLRKLCGCSGCLF